MTQNKQEVNYHGIYKRTPSLYLFLMLADSGRTVVFSTQKLEIRTTQIEDFTEYYKKVSDATTWEEFQDQITQSYKQHKAKDDRV